MTGPASSNTTKPVHELSGPNGSIVRRYRRELLAIARQHGARNLRVFGSTARGQARPDSDVDLLVATAEIVFPTSRRRSNPSKLASEDQKQRDAGGVANQASALGVGVDVCLSFG
jgi:hypothetical protein